nr:cytochrome P450 4F11-like [Macaca fascicularis]
MLTLSLSWLGLGPVAASPWLLQLLVGGSWILAHVLAWTYTFYDNCCHLQCFLRSPKWNWLWGHQGLVTPMEEGIKKFVQLVATQGFKLWLGPTFPLLILCNPDIIRSITSASAAVAPKNMIFYGFMKTWLGDGLLLSGGGKWSHHRGMLTPAFHFNILKPYMKIFNKSVNIMHDKWQRLASESSARLDIFEHLSLMTLDSLQKCIFNFESNCQEKPSEYIATILELSAFVEKRNQQILLHTDFLYHLTPDGQRFCRSCRLVHDFTDAVIQERRRTLRTQGIDDFLKNKAKSKTLDFIDVLLLSKDEDGKELSDEDKRAEADTFMFEGEGLSVGLQWGQGPLHPSDVVSGPCVTPFCPSSPSLRSPGEPQCMGAVHPLVLKQPRNPVLLGCPSGHVVSPGSYTTSQSIQNTRNAAGKKRESF